MYAKTVNTLIIAAAMGASTLCFAADQQKESQLSSDTFIVKLTNFTDKNYIVTGGCQTKVRPNKSASCDNVLPNKKIYIIYQSEVIGTILFHPNLFHPGYYTAAKTGALNNCSITPPNMFSCTLGDPSKK